MLDDHLLHNSVAVSFHPIVLEKNAGIRELQIPGNTNILQPTHDISLIVRLLLFHWIASK